MTDKKRYSQDTVDLAEFGRSLPGVTSVKVYSREEFKNLSPEELQLLPAAVRRMWIRQANK